MKKLVALLLVALTVLPFTMAYVVAHLTHMSGREDMPTPLEWLGMPFSDEYYYTDDDYEGGDLYDTIRL